MMKREDVENALGVVIALIGLSVVFLFIAIGVALLTGHLE